MLVQEICTHPPLLGMALQIDTYNGCAVAGYDLVNVLLLGMVICSRHLAPSYSHSLSLNHPLFPLSSLFMRFLEWLVTSFSFSFVYILVLSSSLVVYNDCF